MEGLREMDHTRSSVNHQQYVIDPLTKVYKQTIGVFDVL